MSQQPSEYLSVYTHVQKECGEMMILGKSQRRYFNIGFIRDCPSRPIPSEIKLEEICENNSQIMFRRLKAEMKNQRDNSKVVIKGLCALNENQGMPIQLCVEGTTLYVPVRLYRCKKNSHIYFAAQAQFTDTRIEHVYRPDCPVCTGNIKEDPAQDTFTVYGWFFGLECFGKKIDFGCSVYRLVDRSPDVAQPLPRAGANTRRLQQQQDRHWYVLSADHVLSKEILEEMYQEEYDCEHEEQVSRVEAYYAKLERERQQQSQQQPQPQQQDKAEAEMEEAREKFIQDHTVKETIFKTRPDGKKVKVVITHRPQVVSTQPSQDEPTQKTPETKAETSVTTPTQQFKEESDPFAEESCEQPCDNTTEEPQEEHQEQLQEQPQDQCQEQDTQEQSHEQPQEQPLDHSELITQTDVQHALAEEMKETQKQDEELTLNATIQHLHQYSNLYASLSGVISDLSLTSEQEDKLIRAVQEKILGPIAKAARVELICEEEEVDDPTLNFILSVFV